MLINDYVSESSAHSSVEFGIGVEFGIDTETFMFMLRLTCINVATVTAVINGIKIANHIH